MRHCAKFCGNRPNRCWDMAIFQNAEILEVGRLKTAEIRHRAKFCGDRWNRCWDMAIIRFFKMAAVAMLDFQNIQILGAARLKAAKMRHRVKFCSDRSNRCWDMAIFDFSRRRPPSWIFKMSRFEGREGSRQPKCVTVPNFAAIGQTVAEIWPFFDFSIWRPPPSWIFKFLKI